MMSGIVKVGTGLGQLLVPLAAAALIGSQGWRGAYVVLGLFSLTILLLGAQFLRRDPLSGREQRSSLFETLGSSARVHEQGLTLSEGVRTRQFWLVCAAEFTMSYCLMTTLVHLVNHARDLGVDPRTIFRYLEREQNPIPRGGGKG